MLQIKLPSSVDDQKLITLNQFQFEISGEWISKSARCNAVGFRNAHDGCTLTIVDGDAHFTDSTNTQDLGKSITIGLGNQSVYFSSGRAIVNVTYSNYIYIFELTVGSFTNATMRRPMKFYSSICYLPLNVFWFFDTEFGYGITPKYLPKATFRSFVTVRCNYPIDMADFSDFEAIVLFRCISNSLAYGDISELGANTSMTELDVTDSVGITGSIESLVSAMTSAGRTSGTLVINATGTKVTYNGELVTGQVNISFE